MEIKCLNLGCGSRYLEGWVNVDFVRTGQNVIAHNLLNDIPYPSNLFDVVYNSHLLEHFPKSKGQEFINECYRVLRVNGVLRVVVPDLETIVREYMKNMELALKGDVAAAHDYDWILLELFDQMVRNKSGGEMGIYWQQENLLNREYIMSRMGDEFSKFRRSFFRREVMPKKADISFFTILLRKGRNKLVRMLLGEEKFAEFIRLGKFRSSGEIHQWMYDRFSLGRMLKNAGFQSVHVVSAFTSNVSSWEDYMWLDVENGSVRKPDSLFMEAIK